MENIPKLEDLPRDEQLDIIFQTLCGHDSEEEILDILAAFVAYKAGFDEVKKYDLDFLPIEEMRARVNGWLNSDDTAMSEKGWDVVLDTIGAERVLDVIEKFPSYFNKKQAADRMAQDLKDNLYCLFVLV